MKGLLTLPLLVIALLTAREAKAAQVWVAPSPTKVRPLMTAPANAPTSATVSAAKNEFESFHVVVTGPASSVSMAFEALTDGKGNSISGHDLVLYREALLNVTQQSGGDGATGRWPDALVPDVDYLMGEKRNAFPFNVPAGESRAVFVDIHVPAGAPAGVYNGNVIVTGDVNVQVPVQLTVWDFSMPSTATLKSAFGMTWNGPCMGHGDGSCSNPAVENPLRARYVQAALDNRISIYNPDITLPVSPRGGANWAGYDQYSGPFHDGTSATRLQGARLTSEELEGYGTPALVSSYSQHFKQKGWFPVLFNYICDEPPQTCKWTDIPKRIADSRSGDPLLTTLVTTWPQNAQKNGIDLSTIDQLVIVVNFMEGRPGTEFAGNQRSKYPANAWIYQGCMSFGCSGVGPGIDGTATSGWPSYAVDTDGSRNRSLEWMSFIYDTKGELYYEMTYANFTGDPWTSQNAFGGTGDGTLFYPGTPSRIGGQTEIPVESLRMKGIRDGMEDYELLNLAKSLGLGDQALQIAKSVFPTAYQGTASAAAIESAREQLAALILHALGKDPGSTGGPDAGTGGTGDVDAGNGGTGDVDAGTGDVDAGTGDVDAGTGTGGVDAGTGNTGGPTGSTDPGGGAGPADAGQIQVVSTGLVQTHGFPTGGCSSTGSQSAWLGLLLAGAFVASRRRRDQQQ